MILEMDDADGRLIVCAAVRYAMCRMTFAPHVVADVVRANIGNIDPGTCAIVARDIRESIETDYRCQDVKNWHATSQHMVDLLPLLYGRAGDE